MAFSINNNSMSNTFNSFGYANDFNPKVLFLNHVKKKIENKNQGDDLFKFIEAIQEEINPVIFNSLDENTIGLAICHFLNALENPYKFDFSILYDRLIPHLNQIHSTQPPFTNQLSFLKKLLFLNLQEFFENKLIIATLIGQELLKISDLSEIFVDRDPIWNQIDVLIFINFLIAKLHTESNEMLTLNDTSYVFETGIFIRAYKGIVKVITMAKIAHLETEKLEISVINSAKIEKNRSFVFDCKLYWSLQFEHSFNLENIKTSINIVNHIRNLIESGSPFSTDQLIIEIERFKHANLLVTESQVVNNIQSLDPLLSFNLFKCIMLNRFDDNLHMHILFCYLEKNINLFKNNNLAHFLYAYDNSLIEKVFFKTLDAINYFYFNGLYTNDLELYEIYFDGIFKLYTIFEQSNFKINNFSKDEFKIKIINFLEPLADAKFKLNSQENIQIYQRILNKIYQLKFVLATDLFFRIVLVSDISMAVKRFVSLVEAAPIMKLNLPTLGRFINKLKVDENQWLQVSIKLKQKLSSCQSVFEANNIFNEIYTILDFSKLANFYIQLISCLTVLINDNKFYLLDGILEQCLELFDLNNDVEYIRLMIIIKKLIELKEVQSLSPINQRSLYDFQWKIIFKKHEFRNVETILDDLLKTKIVHCPVSLPLKDIKQNLSPRKILFLQSRIGLIEDGLTYRTYILSDGNFFHVERPAISDDQYMNYLNLKMYSIEYEKDEDACLKLFNVYRRICFSKRAIDSSLRLVEINRLKLLISFIEKRSLEKSHPIFITILPQLKSLSDLWIDAMKKTISEDKELKALIKSLEKEFHELLLKIRKTLPSRLKIMVDGVENGIKVLKIDLKDKLEKQKKEARVKGVVANIDKKLKSSSIKTPKKAIAAPSQSQVRPKAEKKEDVVITSSSSEEAKIRAVQSVVPEKTPAAEASLEELFEKLNLVDKESIEHLVIDIMKLISQYDFAVRVSYYQKLAENINRSLASLMLKILITRCIQNFGLIEKDQLFFLIIKYCKSSNACKRAFKHIVQEDVKLKAIEVDSEKKMPLLKQEPLPVASSSRPVMQRRNTIYGLSPIKTTEDFRALKKSHSKSNLMQASSSSKRMRSNSTSGSGYGHFFDPKEAIRKYRIEMGDKPRTLDALNEAISSIPGVDNFHFHLSSVRGSHFRFALKNAQNNKDFGSITIAVHGKDITEENIINTYEQIYAFVRTCLDMQNL